MVRYALLVTLAIPVAALAYDDYRCTISRIEQGDEGSSNALQLLRETYVGQQFSVERRTGLMAGALKNSYRTQPVVIDGGSTENAFKVVTTMRIDQGAGAGSSVSVLVVHEWIDGPKKPFTFFDGRAVYFGYCEHF